MKDAHLGAVEAKFADMIWENEPLSSAKLAKMAAQHLSWKKTTAFTVLKRLCDKGLFQNDKGTVTSRMTRDEFYARQSEQFVDETFAGSLPAFLAAFSSRKTMSECEIEALRQLIDRYEKKEGSTP
ncbi:MAG: BlaI/MecI/CopY family transcriptional regulator [Clostridia bacterium]|nr:BlaI/MecI/CopY family transcriptional regulator [Clostridia bacterium]